MKIIGVDVGGTFTDFFVLDTDNEKSFVFKTPSTPENPALAVLSGIQEVCQREQYDPDEIDYVAHGTTVATNALIQRKGGRVALVVTEGFRDLIEIGRQTRPHLYSLQIDQPEPLVSREKRFEISERMQADGIPLINLENEDIQNIIEKVRLADVEACAVCLLFSIVNPEHERRLKEALSDVAGLQVSISSDVQPEFREYERLSTTVLNAYLQPVMSNYLESLEDGLHRAAPKAKVGIYQSSGGLTSIRLADEFPVRTALSGPAAGVVGAADSAQASGLPNVITLDMGGTSADVCLIRNYEFGVAFDRSVGGFPVRLPMVDVDTVGAGGGSIAWLDKDGLMKVGPQSAGARPGPACYGYGSRLPTVTDANLILGRLSPNGLLDGRVALDIEVARKAFQPLAEALGFDVERTALGCINIVVSNMVGAIRSVSVSRGHDPREFALMPFGGGGPLHAAEIANSLGMKRVIIPSNPGILCAQGLVVSDLKETFVRTSKIAWHERSCSTLSEIVNDLTSEADRWFEDENVAGADRIVKVFLDMRYVGQNYELSVPVEHETINQINSSSARTVERITADYWDIHQMHYGHFDKDADVEIINVRVVALGKSRFANVASEIENVKAELSPRDKRRVVFGEEGAITTPVYHREDMRPGHKVSGPAVIEQMDTTTLIFEGQTASVDPAQNIIIE